jgi:hypothetical protein
MVSKDSNTDVFEKFKNGEAIEGINTQAKFMTKFMKYFT